MDNEIKPTGGFGPFVDSTAGKPVEPERDAGFAAIKDKLETSESADTSAGAGLSVVGQFRRAELQDPAKLDGMVRASVSELINSSEGFTGPLSAAEKQSLLDFLSQDPLFRREVESYLRKVLT